MRGFGYLWFFFFGGGVIFFVACRRNDIIQANSRTVLSPGPSALCGVLWGEGLYVHASLIDVASSSFSPFSLCGRRCDVNDMRDAVAYLHAIDVAITDRYTADISRHGVCSVGGSDFHRYNPGGG